MRKRVLFNLSLLLTVLVSVEGWSVPREESYRSSATGGMFKNNYDRLSDNPAYVGAKKNFIEYSRVSSDQKSKSGNTETTDLYTTLDSLSDNRFLLGTITSLGFMGIGGYVEIGMGKNPQALDYNTGAIGNTSVDLAGEGEGEGEASDVVYTSGAATSPYANCQSLTASQEKYEKENNINAKLAIGGFEAGPVILGLSFERTTEIGNQSSLETTDNREFNYTNVRLADSFNLNSITGSYKDNTEYKLAAYNTELGMVFQLNTFIETVELTAGFNYLQYQKDVNETADGVNITTGVSTVNTSTDYSEADKQDGMEYGLMLLTRENILEWSCLTYLSWVSGGLNPDSDRKGVSSQNDNTSYYGSTIVDSTATKGTDEYSGDGIKRNKFGIGIINRKEVVKGLLVGFGLEFSLDLSKNSYSIDKSYLSTETYDDGNGAATHADYTCVTTGSYRDNITEDTAIQTFIIPIGIEYQATESLSWRLGAVHVTTITDKTTKHDISNINEFYNDYDYADVAGNETDYDSRVSADSGNPVTVSSRFLMDTSPRGKVVKSNEVIMLNTYYMGVGYELAGKVLLDLVVSATGTSDYNTANMNIGASATYTF